MIRFQELEIKGVYIVENFIAKDERGVFIKTFHQQKLAEIGVTNSFQESYYSQSVKNVIRGMHFQVPPHDHEKLVYVTRGNILDVILDIRTGSSTYGKAISVKLNEFGNSVFIPKGFPHGFLALSEETTVVYNVSTVYNIDADSGVLWNSFNFDWPIDIPIISMRDNEFSEFKNFKSPF